MARPKRRDPMSSETLMLVLAVVFCAIVGGLLVLVYRFSGVELL
ncbi:MAG TPA: hypothetical protein P5223_10400 [Phycisphaerae bacterium]|jgi:hypothetical protein|nr:hypothetical protein [Phycisphaerae bacterium]